MDTVKRILKHIALRVLRDELQRTNARHSREISELQERVRDTSCARDRARRILDETREDLRKATMWVREHSPANLEARALLESIGHGTDRSFGVVHPFDRWGISPKP